MDYFKREVNEGGGEDVKLVGAVVPTSISHYLNLFCVVDKRSKSSIIRPLIEDWYENALDNFSEKELIERTATMGYVNFKTRQKKRPFAAVINQQEKELRKKGVSNKAVNAIIEKIKQFKKKDDEIRSNKSKGV